MSIPEPCFMCGVNAWTTCKHRKGMPKPEIPKAVLELDKKHEEHYRRDKLQGLNFNSPKAKAIAEAVKKRERRNAKR